LALVIIPALLPVICIQVNASVALSNADLLDFASARDAIC